MSKNSLDLQRVMQALSDNYSREIDKQLFEDHKLKKDRRTKYQKFIDNIKWSIRGKIKSFRKWLAEIIYGEPIYEEYD